MAPAEGSCDPQFLASVVDRIGAGIVVYDSEGTIRYANDCYAGMLDTTPGELRGRHVTSVNPEFDRDQFDAYFDSFEVGETREVEAHNQTLDGERTFPVTVTVTHTRIDGREYHVGNVTEITDRKRRERDLQLFREAVEQAGHTVFITDSDGVIEYVNPRFEHDTGYSAEEAVGATPRILNSGKHSEEFYEELWETILSGDIWEAELVNRHSSGKLYYIKQTIAPITDGDEITNFVAIESDITDQKLREKRLSELTRILRHNLRNTITALKGHAEVLQEDIDEENQSRLSRILDQAEALASTSEKVSDVRRLVTREYDIDANCDLGSLLIRLEPELREEYPDAALSVDAEHLVVGIDPETCRTIIKELVDNAVFHNDRERPEVTVTVTEPDESPDSIELRVADDGPGIPSQEQAAVEIGAEGPLMHSSGIGLSHVHWVVTDYGGEITISDNEPRGTVVSLLLPSAGE